MTITLDAHPLRVSVEPALGASITDLSVAGPRDAHAPILRRAATGTVTPAQTASFVMAPWTNRIETARFGFQGRTHQLLPNFPDGTAIHGIARDAPWRITDRTPVSARLVYDSRADETANFPHAFACVQRFELAPDHLSVELGITNLSDTAMPAALGHHPHFNRQLFSATEDPILRADVTSRYPCEGGLPSGLPSDDEHSRRLRAGAPLGNHNLDDVFAGFSGRASITYPHSNTRVTLDCSDAFTHLVVFTPRAADTPDAPPLPWFCVEPCTAVNNAFNLLDRGNPATGTRILDPGQTLESSMRYRVETL